MFTVLYPANELRIGGAEQQLLELVRGLNKTVFHPIVAPLYSGGPLDEEFRAVPGVEIVSLARSGKFDPSPLWRLASLCRSQKVDIVQPFLTPATFFGLVSAFSLGKPITIVTERCGVRNNRKAGYKIYRSVEDRLSHFANAVVANSAAGRDHLLSRSLPESKIRVFYNGINTERLQVDQSAVSAHRATLTVPDGGHVVGILASLTPAKDHHTFLRAAAEVSQRLPDTRYAIIGDGPLRTQLEQCVAELGLGDRVVFFGYQRRVADLLASCDVLVSSSADNEGCSNSILEAMTLRIPVIATDVGGNCELITPGITGWLTPARDHNSLARTIESVIANPTTTREVASRAQSMVESQFSLRRMVSDYEELYLELLQAKGSRLIGTEPLSR